MGLLQRKPCPYLPDDGTFKYNQHEQSKQAIVPIFIQNPETNAENLEYEKGGGGVFYKQDRE